jgi:hypothetical protein
LEFALSKREIPGLTLEFGVASGGTLRTICKTTTGTVYGFDSFEGLPEDWTHFQRRGRFSSGGNLPKKLPKNAELVIGFFEDTLPKFLEVRSEDVSFVHIDSDLYSSAQTVLAQLAPRMRPGTLILFNEYFNYPGWQRHEHRAFLEYLEKSQFCAEYFGFTSRGQSVAVRLATKPGDVERRFDGP